MDLWFLRRLFNGYKISVSGNVTTLESSPYSEGVKIYKRTSSPETGKFVLYRSGDAYNYEELLPKKTEQVLRYIKSAKRLGQCYKKFFLISFDFKSDLCLMRSHFLK